MGNWQASSDPAIVFLDVAADRDSGQRGRTYYVWYSRLYVYLFPCAPGFQGPGTCSLCYSKEPSKFIGELLTNLPNLCLQEDSTLLFSSTRRETPSTAVRKIVWHRPWHQMWRNTMENCFSIMSTSCFCIILALRIFPFHSISHSG